MRTGADAVWKAGVTGWLSILPSACTMADMYINVQTASRRHRQGGRTCAGDASRCSIYISRSILRSYRRHLTLVSAFVVLAARKTLTRNGRGCYNALREKKKN
jgi:hypothetical protein